MEAIIIGWFSAQAAEWAKRNPSLPFITPETVAAIRALVAVLTVLGSLAAAYLSGPEQFAQFDWKDAGRTLTTALGGFITAHLTYHATIKGREVAKP
jgi:hypothetical protein